MRFSKLRRRFSSAIIWSLFFLATFGFLGAEEVDKRVGADSFPMTVSAPSDWEVFTSNDEDPSEILFLQTPEGAPYNVTVSFSAHPVEGTWDELVRRQSYHLLVWEGVPLTVDEPLKLRGAKGHKWVYVDSGPGGESKVYYRLYILLPSKIKGKKLLLMQGAAPADSSYDTVPQLNAMARSLVWGLGGQ